MTLATSPPLYIKPNPCWKAEPTTEALAHPIGECELLTYTVGSKTRGDCSGYGVANDNLGCWVQVAYVPPGDVAAIQGWISMTRTSADAPPAGDVCGPVIVTNGVPEVYLGMCGNPICGAGKQSTFVSLDVR